jgi:hypothetical protein
MDNIGIREKFGGKTAITVYYAGSDEPDYFDLTEQNGKVWLCLARSHDRRITPAIEKEIRAMFTDEQEGNTDPEVIRTDLDRESFLGRYYEPMLMNPATGRVATMDKWLAELDNTGHVLGGGVNFDDVLLVPVVRDEDTGAWMIMKK